MSNVIYTPYTYLIGWSKLNLWYYGVRFKKGCHPSDLWVSYFTSSKEVAIVRDMYGEPDIIEIDKTFKESSLARNYETNFLKENNVIYDDKWLNKTNNIAIPTQDENVKIKMKKSAKKRCSNPDEIERLRKIASRPGEKNPMYGKKVPKEQHPMFGKKHKQETIEKNRKSNLGQKRKPYPKKDTSGSLNPSAKKILITIGDKKIISNGNLEQICDELNFSYFAIHKMCLDSTYIPQRNKYKNVTAQYLT